MFIRKIILIHVNTVLFYFKTICFKSDMVEDSPLGLYMHKKINTHLYFDTMKYVLTFWQRIFF